MRYGLLAQAPVHWLLGAEKDVRDRILAFAADNGEPVIEVVGPPSVEDMLLVRSMPSRKHQLRLPLVKLQLRKTVDAIEVKVSAADLDEIIRWRKEAAVRRALKPTLQ